MPNRHEDPGSLRIHPDRLVFRFRCLVRVVARILLLYPILFIAWLWVLLALWFFDPWSVWVRGPAAILWGLAMPVGFFLRRWSWIMAADAGGVLLMCLLWSFVQPSNQRNWTADQAHMPVASFDGDTVHIQNLRHTTYHSTEDYDVRWYAQSYDLNAIRTVDFVVAHFTSWRSIAHTFLTFGFADGEHVAVSVEIRKERGESYSPLKGLFERYEIIYVIGEERDLIGLRSYVRKEPVYLFPIKAKQEHVRALFEAMLLRANRLSGEPEFYNTLANSCNTNIVRHLEELSEQNLPFHLGKILPGYADELAFELGLIDSGGSLEEARQRFRIKRHIVPTADGRAWSQQIRGANESSMQ